MHEKVPKVDKGMSLEDVIAEKRTQALQYYDVPVIGKTIGSSNLRSSPLNEDSMTEASLDKKQSI